MLCQASNFVAHITNSLLQKNISISVRCDLSVAVRLQLFANYLLFIEYEQSILSLIHLLSFVNRSDVGIAMMIIVLVLLRISTTGLHWAVLVYFPSTRPSLTCPCLIDISRSPIDLINCGWSIYSLLLSVSFVVDDRRNIIFQPTFTYYYKCYRMMVINVSIVMFYVQIFLLTQQS
jgi:hypothetical protein